MALHFHSLTVARVQPEAAGAAAITLQVPPALADAFDFRPGQFLTVRATIDGQEVRRSYSICSPRSRYRAAREIDLGVKPVEGGLFSNWAVRSLQAGDTLEVMPPDGRFCPKPAQGSAHRVGFAAGSGITPILSIIATTLAEEPESRFTLVYGNQRMGSILFNEALQDLKDRYPARLTLVHVLSRQDQEVPLLHGRLDEAKVSEIVQRLLPVNDIDEAFICGPEGMIEATERALRDAGLPAERIHAERFTTVDAGATKTRATKQAGTPASAPKDAKFKLAVVVDGKTHEVALADGDHVLDAALDAGLDLPYSCKGGVCCTCRARVLEGQVEMDRNFTLEPWEVEKGFVLTCQARPLTARVVVSYDER